MTSSLDITCPRCGALPNQLCQTPKGRPAYYATHMARKRAFWAKVDGQQS